MIKKGEQLPLSGGIGLMVPEGGGWTFVIVGQPEPRDACERRSVESIAGRPGNIGVAFVLVRKLVVQARGGVLYCVVEVVNQLILAPSRLFDVTNLNLAVYQIFQVTLVLLVEVHGGYWVNKHEMAALLIGHCEVFIEAVHVGALTCPFQLLIRQPVTFPITLQHMCIQKHSRE